MKTLKDAIEIILSEPPEPHYPAYYADLLRKADVPDTNDGDTISRQQAIEDIRTMIPKDARFDIKWVEMWLTQLPSAQPEIVRCKDCKYCDRGIDEDGNPFLKCLGWVYGGTQEEDFCSHAERRTDD